MPIIGTSLFAWYLVSKKALEKPLQALVQKAKVSTVFQLDCGFVGSPEAHMSERQKGLQRLTYEVQQSAFRTVQLGVQDTARDATVTLGKRYLFVART